MELSIDEKMRLVREMREKLAREEAMNVPDGFQRNAYRASGYSQDERTPQSTFGLRAFLALCLFGGFLLLQEQNMTIIDKDAQDIVAMISEDGLFHTP